MSFQRSTGLNTFTILALFISWIVPAGASGAFVLKNIEVNSTDESKHISLEFDSEFTGEPLINFESGSISLRFDSVLTSPTLPKLIDTKSHSIIKAIRAIQVPENKVFHLDILFKSSEYKTEFPLITRRGKYVYVGLNGNISSLPLLSSTETLTREAEERVNKDQPISSNFFGNTNDDAPLKNASEFLPVANEDWTVTMLTLVLALLVVLLLIYLIAYLYNRFFSGRFPSLQGTIRIKQVSSFHVGPKQKVIILDMNNRKYACGVTQTSINLITELKDERDQSFLEVISTDEKNDEIKIDQARADYLKTLQPDLKTIRSDDLKESQDYQNHETAFNDLDQKSEFFLKPNSKQENDTNYPKEKNKISSTPIRRPLEKKLEKLENLSSGSQTVQNFAKKLSERLKFLKPIK